MTTEAIDATKPETLRFAYGATALGTILVATSSRGVAALFIGDDRVKLLRNLKEAYPATDLLLDQDGLEEAITQAVTLVNAPGLGAELTLDLRGSPVERAVWTALRSIPAGETRSYGEIARSLPVSATAQEVGAACAANRVAVAVPCHRVVKADGSISGYRWGVQRKRRLLALERVTQ